MVFSDGPFGWPNRVLGQGPRARQGPKGAARRTVRRMVLWGVGWPLRAAASSGPPHTRGAKKAHSALKGATAGTKSPTGGPRAGGQSPTGGPGSGARN